MKLTAILGANARRRAISLIEGVLYLVIALTVIVGGIVFFQQSQLSNAVTDTARAAVGISSQARALYQNQTSFGDNEDLTLAMIRAGAVPSNFIDGSGDAIAHPFGGSMSITGNGKGFVISYSDITEAACLRLASIDETGVGPMGTGIVGLTIAQGETVDPTAAPEMTGAVKADVTSSACTDGTTLLVYYAQYPGAKFVEADEDPEEPLDLWGYPFPDVTLVEACGVKTAPGYSIWTACVGEWSVKQYGAGNGNVIALCHGVRPSRYYWPADNRPPLEYITRAENAWNDCYLGFQHR